MIGRRVDTRTDLEQGGDYCFEPNSPFRVDPDTQDVVEWRPTIFFLLPKARDADAQRGERSVHKVCEPPHVFRQCDDGSIEVRESIACGLPRYWHGYLDEGHVWREA